MKDKWDLRFKNLALEVSEWSKDPSTKVGCIAVKDRRVIATGYNGFPIGISENDPFLATTASPAFKSNLSGSPVPVTTTRFGFATLLVFH